MSRTWHVGIIHTHPIQYYAPWYRELSRGLDLDVFYAHRQSAAGQASAGFGVPFEWDIPLTDGYRYHWLDNVAATPGLTTFGGCDTPELDERIRRGKFDAFVVYGWNRRCFLQAIDACRRHRVPVLMRGDSQLATPRSRARRWLKRLPYRWLLPRLDGHLHVGQRNREYLKHYGVPDARLFFTPHCVDNAFFARQADVARRSGATTALREQLRIPPNGFVFLFVGKFLPKKRAGDFVAACTRIFKANGGETRHAVMVGDGLLRSELEALAHRCRDHIHFVGFRNQSELPVFYAAADALVLPSDGAETWGLVVNEAMASGLPAIVSDAVGCAPDLIRSEETGLSHALGDVDALARCLVEIQNVLRKRPERIREALRSTMAEYSYERATAGLEHALRTVCRPS